MESNTQNADSNSGKKPEKGLSWNQLSFHSAFIAVTVFGILLANYHNNRSQVDAFLADIRTSLNARMNPSPKNVPPPIPPTPISMSMSVPPPPPPIDEVGDVNDIDGDTVSNTLNGKRILRGEAAILIERMKKEQDED